jgi:hypothetical protein
MAVQQRFMALALAGVAFALTVTGVVIAATDANPGSVAKDPLTLNGYPPSSADLLVTVSSGDVGLSANVEVNFKSNKVDAMVHVPLVVTTAAVELRLIDDRLFARSADVSSGPWFDAKVKVPSLFGVALELTKPDVRLITGFQKSETKSGYSTTYVFYRDHVALTSLIGPSSSTSTLGSVRWAITVGNQGEVSKTTLSVKSKKTTTNVSVTVLTYDRPTQIATPTDLKPISFALIRKLLGSESFAKLLVPRDLSSLSQSTLS